MSDTPFYKTKMGCDFYGIHIPNMLKAQERIATALERIADALEDK